MLVCLSEGLSLALLLSFMVVPTRLDSQASPSAPEADPTRLRAIVQGLTEAHQRDSSKVRPYKVNRVYKIFRHDKQKPIFTSMAEINVVPNGVSTYKVLSAEGSSRGKKVVHRLLENETKPTKRHSYGELSNVNYDFAFVRRQELDDHRTYLLRIVPKNKAMKLIKGMIWVDETNYRVLKIEGSPNRKPSWWIKSLMITLRFAEVKGMWLHTSVEATAMVRMFGKYRMTGQDVEVQSVAFSALTDGENQD